MNNEYKNPYEQGFEYGQARFKELVGPQENPYPRGTEDYWDFLDGYLDGYDNAESAEELSRSA